MSPQLKDIILCEDIRQELGNKISLIGILGGVIFIPEDATFPARIPQLALFSRWIGLSDGERISLGVEIGDEFVVDPKNASVTAVARDPKEYSNVFFQLPGFPIRGFGDFKFKLYLGDDPVPRAEMNLNVAPLAPQT
jgi:hypothetical protein